MTDRQQLLPDARSSSWALWTGTIGGYVPWPMLCGLSPLAAELYAVMLEVSVPNSRLIPLPRGTVNRWGRRVQMSMNDLSTLVGCRHDGAFTAARRELEHAGLIGLVGPRKTAVGRVNVYVVFTGDGGAQSQLEHH